MTEDDEVTRGDWFSKQHQRIEESWKIHSPFVALTNLVMLIATLATLAWTISLGIEFVLVFLIGLVFYLWASGYYMDRTGYLQKRTSRLLQMTQTIPMYHQYRLAGGLTAEIISEVMEIGLGDAWNPEATKRAREIVEEEVNWFKSYATGEVGNNKEEN
jgi:hypothetical protein